MSAAVTDGKGADRVVIDFHSHILPGIDDGSKSLEMSLEMLELSANQGVEIIAATPHFYASHHSVGRFLEKRQAAYEKIRPSLTERHPHILLGAEVAFFSGISRAERIQELTLGDTNILLLEMPFAPWGKEDMREVESLARGGQYRIILAHLERYTAIPENQRRIRELAQLPLYVQINAESLTRWRGRKAIAGMFARGEAHLLGSDCHRTDKRRPNLKEGRNALRKILGGEILEEIDRTGERLLSKGDIHV